MATKNYSELQLNIPLVGQENWGNAINENFKILLNAYNSVVSELRILRASLGTAYFNVDTRYFIYITEEDKMTIKEIKNWHNPDNGTSLNIQLKDNTGYLVKTKNDAAKDVKDVTFVSGDLMIIHRPNASNDYTVENGSCFIGGFFVPTEQTVEGNQFKTTYIKKPNFYATESSVEINTPVLYWKPDNYNNSTGIMTFKLVRQNNGQEEELTSTKDINILLRADGIGRYFTLQSGENIIRIENIFNNSDNNDMEATGFDIYFADSNNNVCYFPYDYKKNGRNLEITVIRGGYTGIINGRVSIIKSRG